MNVIYDTAAPKRRLTFATQVLPVLAYVSAIFYGGLIRLAALPEVGFVPTDKLLHLSAFGGLALLLARAAHWFRPGLGLAKKLAFGVLSASLFGLLLELCQACVPYRSADVWDWVADTLGALLASTLAFAVLRMRRSRG